MGLTNSPYGGPASTANLGAPTELAVSTASGTTAVFTDATDNRVDAVNLPTEYDVSTSPSCDRPGNGWRDVNHLHCGPPGLVVVDEEVEVGRGRKQPLNTLGSSAGRRTPSTTAGGTDT
jgi:hypothetical protein